MKKGTKRKAVNGGVKAAAKPTKETTNGPSQAESPNDQSQSLSEHNNMEICQDDNNKIESEVEEPKKKAAGRKMTKRKARTTTNGPIKRKAQTTTNGPSQAESPNDQSQSLSEQNNMEISQDDNNKIESEVEEPTKKATGRKPTKRARVLKPQKDEYFEDKRNLEDLWKQVFPVGTEWDQLDMVYKYKWNFQNLEQSFEEGGKLYGKKIYLFGCTEPQMVNFQNSGTITLIPAVIAIVSPFPPSDKIGINSVQREAEEIVPMKHMKMDWVPYIPLENRDSQVERLKSQIFILGCTQRRAGLKHMKIDRVKKFEYCLPYFYHPFQEDELEQSTVVSVLFPAESKPVFCEFDWELDELEEFTDKLIEEEELDADQKEAFKNFVKEKVREQKRSNREAREARRKKLEEMSEETKTAFQNMKFYKFYPVPSSDTPDVSTVKSPFINRYYGKAHEVF